MSRARPPAPHLTPIARRELSWQVPHRALQQIPLLLELTEDWPSSSSRGNRPGVFSSHHRKSLPENDQSEYCFGFLIDRWFNGRHDKSSNCRLCMLDPTTIQIAPAVCLRLQPLSCPIPARRLLARRNNSSRHRHCSIPAQPAPVPSLR